MSLEALKTRISGASDVLRSRIRDLEERKWQLVEAQKGILNAKAKRHTVYLADGYFADLGRDEALRFVKRRLAALETEYADVKTKLESASTALTDLGRLEEPQDENADESQQTTADVSATVGDEEDPFVDEGGLPIMDIREELDEDGNVVSSSVRPQQSGDPALAEFAMKHLGRAIAQRHDNLQGGTDTQDSGSGDGPMTYGPVPPPGFKRAQPQEPLRVINADVSPQTEGPRIVEIDEPTPDANTEKKTEVAKSARDDKKDYSPKSELAKSAKDDKKVNSEVAKPTAPVAKIVTDEPDPEPATEQTPKGPSIDPNDMLELELMAGDFEEDDDNYDGEWEYGDDESDEDEYGRSKGKVQYAAPVLSAEALKWTSPDTDAKTGRHDSSASKDKRVRFASDLDVKSFDKFATVKSMYEDDGGDEKEEEAEIPRKKLSRFRAQMNEGVVRPARRGTGILDGEIDVDSSKGEPIVRDSIVEKEPVVSDSIVEKGPVVNDTIVEKEPVVSDSIVEKEPVVSDSIVEKEPVVSDAIMENEHVVSHSVIEREPIVSESIIEKEPVVADSIVEREPVVSEFIVEKKPSAKSAHGTPTVSEFIAERETGESKSSPSGSTSPVNTSASILSNSAKEHEKDMPKTETATSSTSKPTRNIFKQKGKIPKTKAKPITPVAETFKRNTDDDDDADAGESIALPVVNPGSGLPPEVVERAKKLYLDSCVTEEQFLQAHDQGPDGLEPEEPEEHADDDENNHLVVDAILEHEHNMHDQDDEDDDGYDDGFGDDEDDPAITRRELAEEYQRLRSRIINRSGGFGKTEQEMAVEPIEPKKVSRFKAARTVARQF